MAYNNDSDPFLMIIVHYIDFNSSLLPLAYNFAFHLIKLFNEFRQGNTIYSIYIYINLIFNPILMYRYTCFIYTKY